MACTEEKNMWINETMADPWGGEVQLIDVATDLQSIYVNIKTPWGEQDNSVQINKGTFKTYTSGEKTYSVKMIDAGYVSGNYIGRIIACYEFVEKINTTTSMIFDESTSQLVEGGMLYFNVVLKDENNNILQHDVDIYKDNVNVSYVYGEALYTYNVTANDVGKILVFQAKFDGTEGINPSQSSTINIEIPIPSTTGSLVCTSVPTGAEIRVNGNDSGYLTPKTFVEMEVGNYVISFRKEGYIECSKSVTVIADQQAEVFCELSTVLKCNQNIKIQDQNYYPVTGVSVKMNNVTEITNSNGLVSFTDITRNTNYTVYKSYGDYTGEDVIVGCKLDPQVLHIVVSEKPKCIDYTAQAECESNDCYWWISDNTCQSMPEGTTEYFDIHIKPYSFYDGKYEEALSKTLEKVVELTGAVANYMSSITGYEYKGIDILEEANKQVIVVRIYLKDTNETSLVGPLIVAGAVVVVGLLLIGIGYIIGTSEGGFSKSDITQLAEDIVRNAEIDAYEHAYNIDKTTAALLVDCLKTIETCDDSLTCFDDSGVTPSLANQTEVLVAYQTTIDSIYTGVADTVEDAEFEAFATKTLAELEIVIEKLESATITPEGAACETVTIIDNTVDDLDKKQGEQELDDCVFDILGECIITKKAFDTMKIIGIGIVGLIGYSLVKDIAKR